MANKQRLIDANALAEHIKDLPTWWADDGGFYGGAMKYPEGMFIPEDILSSIENAPAVDAVEVVRCKDCKHWQESVDGIHKWCPLLMDKETKAESFCSYGERKMVALEDIVDLDAQTKANNEAMRKVIAFMAGERRTDV